MFITPAFAQTTSDLAANTATAAPGGGLMMFAMPFAILLVFYFLVIRPQNKRFQEHRAMINSLQKGDRVVTGGGLIGTVKKIISDDEIVVELAEGVQVHAMRSTIMTKKG